jgi:excisionase family DNA binding protein
MEITAQQAMERLGISRSTLARLIADGTIKARRVGPVRRGVWLIEESSVEKERDRRDKQRKT